MTDEIILTYQLTPREVIRALQSRTRSGRVFHIAIIILLALLGFYGSFIVQFLAKDTTLSVDTILTSAFGGLVLLGGPILLFVGIFYADPFVMRQVYRNPRLFVEQTWRFSEEGIHIKSAYSESQSSWSSFVKAIEDRDFYFLFFNEYVYSMIPKRGIASPSDETRLRELLRSKIAKWI